MAARRGALGLTAAAFVLSGAAGLVYQVAWQRILALHSGVGIYSVAAIVAAFMAGLGAGSYAGGRLSERYGPAAALAAFGVVELAIGAFGWVSCDVYHRVLDVRAQVLYATSVRTVVTHLAALFPPTFLMGMSLPLLVRGLVLDVRSAGRTVGIMYGLNLLGAALGAAAAPWLLIRYYGICGAIRAAAAANVIAGLGGAAAGWALRAAPATPDSATAGAAAESAPVAARHPLLLWVALYAASGFCALSLEILWFRILDVGVKSTAFTFGTLLALYLLGSAAGCLVMAVRSRPIARPLRAFLIAQCALLAYAGVAMIVLAFAPIRWVPGLAWMQEYAARAMLNLGREWDWAAMARLYFGFPLAVFGLPTVLMGVSFPILQQAVHDDVRTTGRKVGLLQAANIAGCVAGSLVTGLVGLRWLGTPGSMRVLMALGVLFALLGLRVLRERVFVPIAAFLLVLAVAMPGQRTFWTRVHANTHSETLVEEDETSVSALLAFEGQLARGVIVQGKHHSWIPFGGIHTRLGAAPSVVHPAPVDVAIIGLGSGDTAWAAACRPQTRSLTVFEIAGGQPRLLERAAESGQFPALRSFLDDPRLSIVVADGRRALAASDRRYDVIEADALWHYAGYSGNLYSVEFFRLVGSRLKPGGLVCTWAPTERIYKSFTTALPHVVGLADREILIGSNDPITIDHDAWEARLWSKEVAAYLGQKGAYDTGYILQRLVPLHRTGRRHPTREMNWDLYPRDEFAAP